MESFYKFASENPWLTFFLAVGVVEITKAILRHTLRTVRVAARGWPPPHLDADGDWKPEPETDKE